MSTRLILAAALTLAGLNQAIAADTVSVDIKLFQFKPGELEVEKGTTVIWTNGDAIEHSVTAGKPGKASKAFDSGFFAKGGSYAYIFDSVGGFTYFCKRHPNMQATVKVVE
jgi:plastocyanin